MTYFIMAISARAVFFRQKSTCRLSIRRQALSEIMLYFKRFDRGLFPGLTLSSLNRACPSHLPACLIRQSYFFLV
jgi:hypothetical protein